MAGPFTFENSLSGKNFPSQSDQFGLFLTSILGPDGSSANGNPVLNSLGILAPLAGGGGAAPGYIDIAVETKQGGGPSGWFSQLDLIPGTGVIGTATAGQPGFNANTCVFGYGNDTTYPNGSAWACVRSNAGAWSIQQQLIPGDGAPQGGYGGTCAVFGNIAVVSSAVGSGAAIYAFRRSGNSWVQFQQFQPAGIGGSDGLAIAAMTGTQLFLSAINQATNTGAVYVFSLIGGIFVQVQKLTGAAQQDFFGISVSSDGLTLVIGGGLSTTGKAYVYTQPGANVGPWSLLTTLVGSDSVNGDSFGYGVAVSGTLLVAGARNATVSAASLAGAAYVFQFLANTWTQVQKINASPVPVTQTYFGWSVAAYSGSPSWVAVGAPAVGNTSVEGTVYFFVGPTIAPVVDPYVTLTLKGEKVYT